MFIHLFRKLSKPATVLTFILFIFLSTGLSSAEDEDSTLRETKTKEGFIVNLKDLIKRSKKKMKKVDQRIEDQAKEKRNFEREEKARKYYEKAMRLYDKGKYEDAKELWEKAIKITEHPEMEGYVRKSVKRDKKKEKAMLAEEKRRLKRLETERGFSAKEVEKRYKEAVSQFKKEKYLAAKLKFEEVDDMFPDHKATRSYMKLIQQMIDEEQEGLIDDALRKEVFASSKQRKEAWKKDLERKEKARQQQLAAQAELVYQEAVKFYKSKKYEEAKDRFKEVEWILPDYKKTIKYLKKLDKTVAEKGLAYSEEEQIKYFARQLKDEKLTRPSQPDERARARHAKELLKEQEKRRKEEAQFVYDAARTLYKKKYYTQAYERFLEVETIHPGYKKTMKFLKKIRKKSPEVAQNYPDPRMASTYTKKKDLKYGDRLVEQVSKERLQGMADEAEQKYAQAMSFYNSKNYVEAKHKFIAVEAIFPDYKQTRNYLSRVDDDIARFQPGVAKRKDTFLVKTEPVSEPRDAEGLYRQAMDYYKKESYMHAKESFLKLNQISPGYRSTERYLKRIENKIKEQGLYQQERDEKQEVYEIEYAKEEVEAFKEEVIEYAAQEYEEEENIGEISRKEKRALKKQQKGIKKHVKKENRKQKRELKDVVKNSYRQGQLLYKKDKYVSARAKFAAVERLYPGYKSARKYIKKIDKKIGRPDDFDESEMELAEEDSEPVKIKKPKSMSKKEYEDRIEEEQIEDKNVREFAKKERLERLKREDMEKQQQKEELARIKEEEEGYKLQKEREDKEYKEKEIARLKKKAVQFYREAIKFYKSGDVNVGESKMDEYVHLLNTSDFSDKYKKKMRKRMNKDVERIKKNLDKKRRKDEELAFRRKLRMADDDVKLEVRRERELELLEKKIRMEEERLEREKRQEKERLVKLSQKVKVPVGAGDRASFAEPDTQASLSRKKLDRLEKEKIRELERLVKIRREKLRYERKRVRKEFKENLDHLYKKAVKLYKKGNDVEASQMFYAVHEIQPGYKKTDKYLAKLGMRPGTSMQSINNHYQPRQYTSTMRAPLQSKRGRLSAIRNALDAFEEKLW